MSGGRCELGIKSRSYWRRSYQVDGGETGIELGCVVRVEQGLLERSDLDVCRLDHCGAGQACWNVPTSTSAGWITVEPGSKACWNVLTSTSAGLLERSDLDVCRLDHCGAGQACWNVLTSTSAGWISWTFLCDSLS